MKISKALTLLSALVLNVACGDDSQPPTGMTDGETEGETEGETDPIEPEADCSCFFDELAPPDFLYCLEPEEVVPGCNAPAPACDAIEVFEEEFEGGNTIENPESVDCVLERLAAGERISFEVSSTHNLGGGSQTFWPTDNGYVHTSCGLFDNPPESSSAERLLAASPEFFAECLDPDGELAPEANYMCLLEGFSGHDDPLTQCGT